MVSIISSNSSSLLKTEIVSLVPDNDHYSTFEGMIIEEDSMIESLPSLYFSEVTKAEDDTEDDDEDTLVIQKAPPVAINASKNTVKKAPLSSSDLPSPSPPTIETYSPQLDYSLYSPSVKSNNYPLSALSAALPVNSSCSAARNPTLMAYNNKDTTPLQLNPSSSTSTKMDIRLAPPQPSQSTSRFMNALHRLRSVNSKHPHQGDNSVAPADMKVTPSKSSLADKIKSKLHQQLKNRPTSLDSSISITRSSSLSNWSSRLSKATHQQQQQQQQRRNTTTLSSSEDTNTREKTSTPTSFSLTKSISSHRLYNKHQEARTSSVNRLRQPVKVVNTTTTVAATTTVTTKKPPTISKIKKNVRFIKLVSVRETYSKTDYDRASDPQAVCSRLTPMIAQQIKEELNYYKLHEMQVHESSRANTHFFI